MTDQNKINVSVEMQYKGANEKQLLSLAEALKQLKSAAGGSQVFNQYTKNLDKLATSIRTLDKLRNTKFTGFVGELSKLSNGLKAMGDLGDASSKMTKALNSLSKIPDVLGKLDNSTMDSFTQKIDRLVASLTPLNQMSGNITIMFNSMNRSVNKVSRGISQYNQNQTRAMKNGVGFWGVLNTTRLKMLALTYVMGRVTRTVSGFVRSHSDYVENVALFNQSMGQYAEEAGAYAEEVEALYGINISDWARNQGMFMSIARGMGVATDNAYKMSKSMNELAYDMSAFFNIDQEEAFTKLKSGLTGEIEPLRNLGYALTQQTLQEEAYRMGIKKRVTQMNEAEKAELRYQAIMRQSISRNVMGALAREINNPASALRILQGQFRTLARALGSLFIPMLIKVMPYIQAMTKVLIEWIRALAGWFGVELPTWENKDFGAVDYGTSGMEDLTDATDGAIGKQKELKGLLAGFDQLNILDQNSDSSGGSGGGIASPGVSDGLGIDLLESKNFLDAALSQQIDGLTDKMKNFLIATGLATGALAGLFTYGKIKTGLTALTSALGGSGPGSLTGVIGLIGTKLAFLGESVALFGGALTAPMWAVIAVFVALGAAVAVAIKQLWDENGKFKEMVIQVWESIKDLVSEVWTAIEPWLSAFSQIIGKVLVASAKYMWEAFKNLVEGLLRVFGELWLLIEPIVTWLIKTFGTVLVVVLGTLGSTFAVIFGAIGVVIGVAIDIVALLFNKIADGLKWLRENLGNIPGWIMGIIKGVSDKIVSAISGTWESIKVIWQGTKNFFGSMWDGVKNGAVNAWEGIKKTFSVVTNWFKDVFSKAWNAVKNVFSSGGKVFSGIKEGIASVFSTVVNTLIRGIEAVINAPIRVINTALNKIRDFSILGSKPFKGFISYNMIPTVTMPRIPAYETGTNFVPETGLALLHKGETVIPAKQGRKYQEQGGSEDLLDETRKQNALLQAILEKDQSISLDGTKLKSQLDKVGTRMNKSLGYSR